jgi:uncharacterized protein YkwD
MNGKLSIIIIMILVTAAILTVQSSSLSMLQSSYAQLCPDGSTPDASGNCPTEDPPAGPSYAQLCPDGSTPDASGNCPTEAPPAGDGDIQAPPPAGDGETAQAPPPATTETPPPATETPPPATTVTAPPATETPPPATTVTAPPATETPPAGASQVSNNTGNAYCETCNNDIYYGGGDLKSMVLAVHNRERAAVGVPPLVWSDTLAADAQAWAEVLAKQGQIVHCAQVPGCDPKNQGENLASGGHTTTVPIAQNMQGWVAEKNVFQGLPSATGTQVVGHYTQMIWKSTTEVGCGTASGGPDDYRGWDILVCRYLPWGNTGPNPFE